VLGLVLLLMRAQGMWHWVLGWLVGVCWPAPAVIGLAPDPFLLLLLPLL
jgi:hypothetical protein